MIAFPNYPTSAWNNASNMARDIAKVIDSRFWIPEIGAWLGRLQSPRRRRAAASASSRTSPGRVSNTSYAKAAAVNASYSLVTVVFRNPRHSDTVELSFRNGYAWNGTVDAPAVIGEGQVASITVSASQQDQHERAAAHRRLRQEHEPDSQVDKDRHGLGPVRLPGRR